MFQTTPAYDSLVQLAPYVRKGFFDFKVSAAAQQELIGSIDFGAADAEAEFAALLQAGNKLKADDKKKRQKARATAKSRL